MVRPDIDHPETLAIHAGERPDPVTGARSTPIYRTASFVLEDGDTAAQIFRQARPGYVYSRVANPTVAVLEERIAAMEGGVAAIATGSGQAALHLAIVTLMGQGGHIVASSALYGGTVTLLGYTLPRFGITTTFVDPRDHEGLAAAITPDTRLILGETIANPVMTVLDIPAVAAIAHQAGVPLLVDNTFASPALCRPMEWGADLVFHSATKYLAGNGSVMGGLLVDGGTFDWDAHGPRYGELTRPYDGFHGMTFTDEYGPAAFAARARTEGLRDFGAIMSPDTAFTLIQGCQTLAVRMPRHVSNAQRIAEFLRDHEQVDWVAYPGLADHPDHDLAAQLMGQGPGAVLSFGIRGGRPAGQAFIKFLEVFSHLANIGDLRSLVIHPASTTHQRMTPAQLQAAGIGEDLIRLSIGLEHVDDLTADLDRALRRAAKADA
ncbi:MAG: O-acetylhomoserine aminocarboxypropyltransferase [Euzebya sp.]